MPPTANHRNILHVFMLIGCTLLIYFIFVTIIWTIYISFSECNLRISEQEKVLALLWLGFRYWRWRGTGRQRWRTPSASKSSSCPVLMMMMKLMMTTPTSSSFQVVALSARRRLWRWRWRPWGAQSYQVRPSSEAWTALDRDLWRRGFVGFVRASRYVCHCRELRLLVLGGEVVLVVVGRDARYLGIRSWQVLGAQRLLRWVCVWSKEQSIGLHLRENKLKAADYGRHRIFIFDPWMENLPITFGGVNCWALSGIYTGVLGLPTPLWSPRWERTTWFWDCKYRISINIAKIA